MPEPMEHAASTAERRPSSYSLNEAVALVAWLLVIFGVVLRLRQYMANRSLWLDEAALAVSIASRSLKGLLQPLEYDQHAPIGFLLLEKLAVRLFGTSEYALRLVPLTAGICSVPLFYRLIKQCLQERAGLLAMCLFCASEPLIYYASEVKQYSSDVAIAVAILLLTMQSLQHGLSVRRYIGLALIGAIAVWFSHPAVFVMAGSGITLAAREVSEGRRGAAYKVLLVAAIWGLSFGINYALFGRTLASDKTMASYWASDFAPLPTSGAAVMWYVKVAFRLLRDVFGPPSTLPELGPVLTGLSLVAALVGIGNLFENRRWSLAALLTPVAFTLVASSLKLYPFVGRLVLFMNPILILLVAAGMQENSPSTRPSARIIRLATALLVLAPLASATMGLARPAGKQESRDVLRYLGEHASAGDLVYTYPGFQPSLDYYKRFSKIAGLSNLTFLQGDTEQWPTYDADMARLRGHNRIWVYFCRTAPDRGPEEQGVVVAVLDQKGRRLDEFHATGAALYLYDMSIPAQR